MLKLPSNFENQKQVQTRTYRKVNVKSFWNMVRSLILLVDNYKQALNQRISVFCPNPRLTQPLLKAHPSLQKVYEV